MKKRKINGFIPIVFFPLRCDEAELGLAQRSITDIFTKIQTARADKALIQDDDDQSSQIQSSETTFKGSFFEIFNERIYDLLASDSLEKTLAVRENTSGVYVEGLREVVVHNISDVEDLLENGLTNRQVASTNMNRTSSRSHALFVLTVQTEDVTQDGLRKVRTSKFTLVDLAGSERQKKSSECKWCSSSYRLTMFMQNSKIPLIYPA